MESGVTFEMIRTFVKKIWLFVAIGVVMGAVIGGVFSKINGKSVIYEANATVFVDRNFTVDNNGNGLYDNDINRFWGNFMAFADDPNFLDQLKDEYSDFQSTTLEKKFSNGSNLLQLTYRSDDKKESIGIVNAVLKQITTNAEKFLSEKATISETTEATSNSVIEHEAGSTTSDIMIGGIYGVIIGFILGVCRLFLKKK